MTVVIPEGKMADVQATYDPKKGLFYLKLVSIGKNTIAKTEGKILPPVQQVGGFIVDGPAEDIRAELHKIVDRAVDAWEKSREQES